MSEAYTVIHCGEDGDVTLSTLDKATLENRLNEEYWGPTPIVNVIMNQHIDLRARCGLYIIKGLTVLPKAAEKVTKWEL